MWPMLLDMSRDECKRILRRLELEAYGSLVSALRAQGELGKEKRKLLQDLASILNISMERHRAEIRRAVNDEKLTTIAEHIGGPNTSSEWAIEGRRLIPLMPRLVPQTAFTALANNVANITAAENAKLPPPASTVKKKNVLVDESPVCEPNVPEATKTPQQSASLAHLGTMLKRADSEEKSRKRRRTSLCEGATLGHSKLAPILPPKLPSLLPPLSPDPRPMHYPMSMPSMKLSVTSTQSRANITTTTSSSPTQKVIIVSSSNAAGSPSILQRSLSVPVVKTMSATSPSSAVTQPSRGTLILNNSGQASDNLATSPHPGASNIVTISTNPANLTATTVSIGGIPTSAYISSQAGPSKIRAKSVQLPAKPRPRAGSIVIPMTPNQLSSSGGSTQVLPNLQLKSTSKQQVHIKQDAMGVKLMPTPSTGGNPATKILPKPSGGQQSPLYVMSTTTSTLPMVTRTVPASAGPRSTTSHLRPTMLLSKGQTKTVHISAQNSTVVRPGLGKSNVIVVQKGGVAGYSRGVTLSHSGKEIVGKVVMGKSLASSLTPSPLTTMAHQKPATIAHLGQSQPINIPVSSTQGNVIVLDLSQEHLSKNSVLAEILQVSRLLGEGVSVPKTANFSTMEQTVVDGSGELQDHSIALHTAVHQTNTHTNVLGVTDTSPPPVAYQEDVRDEAGVQEIMEVIGELDPQTGIYSIHPSPSQTTNNSTIEVQSASVQLAPSCSSSGNIDIYSAALSSANINLDSLEYVEEAMDCESEVDASSCVAVSVCPEVFQVSDKQHTQSVTNKLPQGLDSTSHNVHHEEFLVVPTTQDITAVTVEPSHMDTTGMHIEDFSSQKVEGDSVT